MLSDYVHWLSCLSRRTMEQLHFTKWVIGEKVKAIGVNCATPNQMSFVISLQWDASFHTIWFPLTPLRTEKCHRSTVLGIISVTSRADSHESIGEGYERVINMIRTVSHFSCNLFVYRHWTQGPRRGKSMVIYYYSYSQFFCIIIVIFIIIVFHI